MTYTVAALYQFVTIPDPAALRETLKAACAGHGIIGTLLVAPEGINGTIAGSAQDIDGIVAEIRTEIAACEAAAAAPAAPTNRPRCTGLEIKYSACEARPFQRMKVKLKREIVTFGVPAANPAERVGTYIEPADWNALIQDPDVVLVDTRNAYEVKVGTFRGARDPRTQSFVEFPAYVEATLDPARDRKVAMFCTGGIRCEKASAYLVGLGFEQVYHLKGGILKYLETIPPEQSLWDGECFVFDERVALAHGVTEGSTRLCTSCGEPIAGNEACPCEATGPRPSAA